MSSYEMLGEGHQALKSLVIIDDNEQPIATISSENGALTIDLLGTRKVSLSQDAITVYDGQGNERSIPFR